ncbi:hypothetical protein [Clostridium paraputrificum]|uniref:hypothetical protein n=1 Tax=Clostridium paraputrificum TaxID=29363 RepID=UPI0024818AEF|nr:hypothetical protein [Clostridium paraputrificum]MDB2085845.1 hypothetical protein [Clostridium paraputrificum]
MENILIHGVGKKISISNDYINISKTIGKDIEIPLTKVTNIDYEKGTMSKNGVIKIEWNNIDGKLLGESIMFRCFSNDIVEEFVSSILRCLEDPGKSLEINQKEKTGFFQQINIESKEEVSKKSNPQKERLLKLQKEGIPYCPKCKSTSLTTTNKKLSLGRAAVGGVLLGGAGAILGGLTSKKVELLCMNCGYKFKPGKK